MYKSLVAFLFSIVLFSCTSDVPNPNELKEVSFVPTQCSEPWDESKYTNLGGNRGSRIITYLKDNGIKDIYNFDAKSTGEVVCLACTCSSAEQITFKVSNTDFEKIKKIPPFSKYL